uniref:Uncharacterized protein n=1 Tax=Anguilla anguilla TaxID=7936 RepID=A0A0E9TSJ5_ANGAN
MSNGQSNVVCMFPKIVLVPCP